MESVIEIQEIVALKIKKKKLMKCVNCEQNRNAGGDFVLARKINNIAAWHQASAAVLNADKVSECDAVKRNNTTPAPTLTFILINEWWGLV